MFSEEKNKIIYSPAVIDFMTVAVEFCALLESDKSVRRDEWVNKMLKILPLLYVKALMLPDTIQENEELPENFVKEEDYARVETKVTEIMGEENTYLEVFMEDMKYSDRPISAFVSENMADIYQDLRNLVSVYQHNLTEQMNDALFFCKENFHLYWGQKLVNVLRPLHAIYLAEKEDENFTENDLNMEDLWD